MNYRIVYNYYIVVVRYFSAARYLDNGKGADISKP